MLRLLCFLPFSNLSCCNPTLPSHRELKMNTSVWGRKEDNVCRDSSDGYWPNGGKSWWNFIDLWQTAPCCTPRSMSPLPLFCIHLPLEGFLNARACSRRGAGEEAGEGAPEKRWQMCETPRGSSGLLVSAFDLRDWRTASRGFRLLLYIPPATSEGM